MMTSKCIAITVSLCILSVIVQVLYSQTTNMQERHLEVPDDIYTPVSRDHMPKGPAYTVRTSDVFTTQVNIDEDGNDIIGDAANEPSIAVDPTNPNRMVIGWRQFDTIDNNFRQAGYGYSLDGGLSWVFPGVLDPGNFRSDPVLDFDSNGNFYYNSLQGDFSCDVFAIRDGGVVWEAPIPANGGDKQWMRVDRTEGLGAQNIYAHWNLSFTTCDDAFTRSTDDGLSFEDCVSVPENPFWGTLAVNRDGILYVTGTSAFGNGIVVIRSFTAQDPNDNFVWEDMSMVNLDGSLDAFVPINPQGLLGQTWVDVDISEGPGQDNVYVLASVRRISNSDPADVMFARSTDAGVSFESPIRINTDNSTSNYQWFGTMAVAPNGRIDVIWLDTRDAPAGTFFSELYYSFSEDQGVTWSENESMSIPFDPTVGYPQQNKMGDYFDMVSDNEGAHIAWTNTINGGQDVYYSRIIPSDVLSNENLIFTNNSIISYPNPFTDQITILFNLQQREKIQVEVYDILGKKISSLLNEETSGEQKIIWDGTNQENKPVTNGMYFILLRTSTTTEIIKVLKQ